mgnify:CR=1 FL=1
MTILSRACILVSCVILSSATVNALDFKKADSLLGSPATYTQCQTELESLLEHATTGKEKAEVYWRLSRLYLIKGQYQPGKKNKREIFAQGVRYGEEAIKADPSNPDCYMWHSGNVGREVQTHSMMEQASAVPTMVSDLSMIVDNLKRQDYSPAWQALAEIYYRHPIKSTDAAINFERQAVATIPAGETRISTYTLLAEMLHKRGYSAAKRADKIKDNEALFGKSYKSNLDKYSYYDGSLGVSHKPVWANKSLGSMSDVEEAEAIAAYVVSIYNKSKKTEVDKADFRELTLLTESWK